MTYQVTVVFSFIFQGLNFEGALKFYFEDGREKLTKAVRLTNTTSVADLLPTLIEKFKPDLANSPLERKAKLYEVHEEGKCKHLFWNSFSQPAVRELRENFLRRFVCPDLAGRSVFYVNCCDSSTCGGRLPHMKIAQSASDEGTTQGSWVALKVRESLTKQNCFAHN